MDTAKIAAGGLRFKSISQWSDQVLTPALDGKEVAALGLLH